MNNKNKIRVLIIDNHALTRFGLKTALKIKENLYEIAEAESGEQGIEAVNLLIPDIVVMDIDLSGINGIETAKKIKSINENIKIIILTSNSSEETVIDAISAGAQAYCLKQIIPEKLLQVIDFIKDGAIWFDPGIAKSILNIFTQKTNLPDIQAISCACAEENAGKIQLTDRERDVLELIAAGKSNAEISTKLCVSIHTAKAHVCSILHKLSVDDRTQAAIKALKANII
ncbi:MAG TPA: response regulator transcription factor [Candidatus Gastranaerophilales bacterium]|nr:response regulator transcription factor [Candidatus Gastranaerophilales bacterium]